MDGLLTALRIERGVKTPRDRVDVRSRILDAAHAEFTAAGVGGARIQAIASAAEVSPMTVYNHFQDKEGLLTALLEDRGPVSLFATELPMDAPPEEVIERFVLGTLRLTRDQRDLMRVVMSPNPITRRAFNRVRTGAGGLEERLTRVFRTMGITDEIEPEVAVSTLMGMIMANGFLLPTLSGREVGTPEELAPQITRVFLGGVRSRGDETGEDDRA